MYTYVNIYGDLNFFVYLSQLKDITRSLQQKDKDMAPSAAAFLGTLFYWKELSGYKGVDSRMIRNVRGWYQEHSETLSKGGDSKMAVFPGLTSSIDDKNVAFKLMKEFSGKISC